MKRINSYKSPSDFVKALGVVVAAQEISYCENNFKNSAGVSGEEKIKIASVNEDGSVKEENFEEDDSDALSISKDVDKKNKKC